MSASERFIFGYEILKRYGLTSHELLNAIRQGKLKPHDSKTLNPLPAPSIRKRVRKFSENELFTSLLEENRRRRLSGLGPLDPGTKTYETFLNDCWHTEADFSWEHLSDSQEDQVKTWSFLIEEIELCADRPHISGRDLLEKMPLFEILRLMRMRRALSIKTDAGAYVHPIQWEPEERQDLCRRQLAVNQIKLQRGQGQITMTSIPGWERKYVIDLDDVNKETIETFWFGKEILEQPGPPIEHGGDAEVTTEEARPETEIWRQQAPLKPGDPSPVTLGSFTGVLLETHHHAARTFPHLEKSFHNDPELFPDLELAVLVDRATSLAANHKFIRKITLYRNASRPCQDMSAPTYVLALEVPDDEQATSLMQLRKENPQALKEIREAYRQLREIEREKEKAWEKYWENPEEAEANPPAERETRLFREVLLDDPKSKLSEAARGILQATQEISDSTWSEVVNQFQPDSFLRFIVGDSFVEVIKPHHRVWLKENAKSIWDDWKMCRCSPGEEPAEVSGAHWVLFKQEDEIEPHELREASFGVDDVQKVLNQGLDAISEKSAKGVEILGHAQQMDSLSLNQRPVDLNELLQSHPEFEVFQMLRSGELVPVDRNTGNLIRCPSEQHEYSFRERPEVSDRLFHLELFRRCVLADGEVDRLVQKESSLVPFAEKMFGKVANKISLAEVEAMMRQLEEEVRQHESKEKDETSDDPDREKWEHLILPRTKEEASRLKNYLPDAVFYLEPKEAPEHSPGKKSLDGLGDKVLSPESKHPCSFILDGDSWHITFKGKSTTIKNNKRIRYVVCALEHKRDEIRNRDLVNGADAFEWPQILMESIVSESNADTFEGSQAPMEVCTVESTVESKKGLSESERKIHTKAAQQAYKDRCDSKETADEVQYQGRWNKFLKYMLNEHGLKVCITKTGQIRLKDLPRAEGQDEKARKTVSINIKNARVDVSRNLPELADHLENNLKCGIFTTRYDPMPDIEWHISH
jgi:hypothetical protein